MKRSNLYKTVSVIAALLVWQLTAMIANMPLILVTPLQVFARLCTIWTEDGFFSTVAFSLLRIFGGFALAFLAGSFAAVAAGRFRVVEYLLWPYVITVKSVPIASIIIICLMWLSFRALTVFIAFLIVFPVIYTNVLHGIHSTPAELLEMAMLYRIPWHHRFMYIYLPHLKPYLLSACTISIGMAWKAGVAAEVIGVVSGSIGEKLYNAKIYFETPDLFAWTIVIIVLSVGIEKLVSWLLRHAFAAWEK